jgi:cytoskeletal protein RodZ
MNPGAIEEGAKAAGTFMGIMKEQPLSLALSVMNIGLIGLIWWFSAKQVEVRNHDLELYFAHQRETSQLLARCIIPVPKQP